MGENPSSGVKKMTIKVKRQNGNIYVYERQIRYDPIKKYNIVVSNKLIGKILKGEDTIKNTRPKRAEKKSKDVAEKNKDADTKEVISDVKAKRTCIGTMKILEYVGNESGINNSLYASFDIGTAQKIISLIQYFLATNGQSAPAIEIWQLTHPIPYTSGITENIYHNLYSYVGHNETAQQKFFIQRCSNLCKSSSIAYDSTTISTYSENQNEARFGYNKENNGLKTIKVLTLYSIDNLQPIAFSKQPGNIPDVITLKNALNQLSVLGVKIKEIITDNGYYSGSNIAELLYENYNFITLIKISTTWVKKEIDTHFLEFSKCSTICDADSNVHCITISKSQTFTRSKLNCSNDENDCLEIESNIFLHIYFSAMQQAQERLEFDSFLIEIKNKILNGDIDIDSLDEKTSDIVNRYLDIVRSEDGIKINFKDLDTNEEYKYHGFFALISNKEKSASTCLIKYRKRNLIEQFFRAEKNSVDGKKPRVWDSFSLRGRLFIQFVALCYYEYIRHKINQIKESLGIKNGDKKHDTKLNLSKEIKLKTWLDNTPIYLILQWFDVIENVDVSTEIKQRRWNSAVLERDRLFLEKFGIEI